MRTLVIFSLLLAVACAQFYPFPGYGGFPRGEDLNAASLGGAPVGVYDKKHVGGPGGLGGLGGLGGSRSEVTGASLGGAKVGIYGKEHPREAAPLPYLVPLPVALPWAL